MSKRSEQRERTRSRIVAAAAQAFSELGFHGASTREIAQRADANQGLITYHFRSKEDLWRAAANEIFEQLRMRLFARLAELASEDPRERLRESIREYVRFAAAHPELFQLMVEEGKRGEERMRWLVETHLRPIYERAFGDRDGLFRQVFAPELLPHVYYTLAGAGSLIFALEPECRQLTGLDPTSQSAIETHATFVANLLVPERTRAS